MLILAAVIACAVSAVCIYSCVRKSKEYTLNLNYGEAHGDITSLKAYDGEIIGELPAGLTVQDKYYLEFDGWYTEAECCGTKVAGADGIGVVEFGAELKDLSRNNTLQLYAGFKVKEYTVTLTDGINIIKRVKAQYGTLTETLTEGVTASNGLTILSWSDSQGGSEFNGEVTGDITLYVLSYGVEISFDSNGGSEVSGLSATVGNVIDLPAPTRQYYRFTGWADENGLITGTYTAPGKKTTLTAQWEKTHFTVTYDTAGGSEAEPELVAKGTALPLPNTTRAYYRLSGWEYNGQIIGADFVMPDRDITLTAQWEKTHYSVTFNSNGGTSVSNEMVRIGEYLIMPEPYKTGYSFIGWYDSSNRKYEGTLTPESDIVLTAKWRARTYIVTLDPQGGALTAYAYDAVYDELYNLPVPERSGYCFEGWYTTAVGGERKTARNGKSLNRWTELSNLVLYAHWEQLQDYTVELNRQSCKTNTGYNPDEQGTELDKLAHEPFELIELNINGCVKGSSGAYHLAQGGNLNLSAKILNNIRSLPKSTLNGNSVNWTDHYVESDIMANGVYGTNINNQQIGQGAYYVKVTYNDGTYSESNKVDFMNGAQQNQVIELSVNVDSSKSIKTVEVVFVYELFYKYWRHAFDWGGYSCWASWRCSTTMNFE